MRKIDILRELQELDTALDLARGKLEAARPKLGDDSELVPLRTRLDAARHELRSLQTKGMDLDLLLEKETTKLKADEKKLYDGSIKNSKELNNLAQDVEMQRERISRLEDKVLMNMEALESAAAAVQEVERVLTERERLWESEQAALRSECEALDAEIEKLSAARNQVAGRLDAATIRTYENIRRTRGGLAVAPVEQRSCRGCRISLSSSEMQRARSSPEPVTCQSCGRFLYVP